MVLHTQDNIQVLAVVLNYNLAQEAEACVDSLLRSDYEMMRVVVVDNGSTDDSVMRLRARYASVVQVIDAGRNHHFAGGMNIGFAAAIDAGAEWALILNNDTRVAPDMVSRLVETGAASARIGVVAPLIVTGDVPPVIWDLGTRNSRWLPFPVSMGSGQPDKGQYVERVRVDYVTGCCLMARCATLRQVGQFDGRRYPMYYEDADFCERVRAAGYEIWVDPQARMQHLVSTTMKPKAAQTVFMRTRSRFRFYWRRIRGAPSALVFALIIMHEVAQAFGEIAHRRADLAAARCRGFWHFCTRKGL